MEQVIGLVAVIGFFTSVIVGVYLFLNSRHKIRMALIQHGQDAGIFKEEKDASSALKYGLVAVGLGAGLFVGTFATKILGLEEDPTIFGFMLMLGGAGLILYYLIIRMKKGEE